MQADRYENDWKQNVKEIDRILERESVW